MASHHSDSEDHGSVELSPPTDISPYQILNLDSSATPDQIKSAYRKAALRHHPDKAAPDLKDAAHQKFQEIAFAYAILSDPVRRKRYDTTGNTSESLDEDFNWTDFFRAQSEAVIDGASIEKIKTEYQGSEEEREDLLRVYTESQGDMDAVYEQVLCSDVVEDDERFRKIIGEAIEEEEVEEFEKYRKDGKKKRKQRIERAKKEEGEAEKYAEELGVGEKLFGKKKKGEKNGEDALKDLILQRQKGRAEGFFEGLEAKYGAKNGSKKRGGDEPSEEAFQKNAKKARRKMK